MATELIYIIEYKNKNYSFETFDSYMECIKNQNLKVLNEEKLTVIYTEIADMESDY